MKNPVWGLLLKAEKVVPIPGTRLYHNPLFEFGLSLSRKSVCERGLRFKNAFDTRCVLVNRCPFTSLHGGAFQPFGVPFCNLLFYTSFSLVCFRRIPRRTSLIPTRSSLPLLNEREVHLRAWDRVVVIGDVASCVASGGSEKGTPCSNRLVASQRSNAKIQRHKFERVWEAINQVDNND